MAHTSNFDSIISTYKIINYVLDEIDLTSSTTSNSNIENKELHQKNYIPMIVKIYRERSKTKKSRGRR
jgi:hypothetical protein